MRNLSVQVFVTMANYLFATTILSGFFRGEYVEFCSKDKSGLPADDMRHSITKPIAHYKGFPSCANRAPCPLLYLHDLTKAPYQCRSPSTLPRFGIQRRSQLGFSTFLTVVAHPIRCQTLCIPLVLQSKVSYRGRGSYNYIYRVTVG